MSIIFFDVETTGLLKAGTAPISLQPSIIEIYCLKTNDDCTEIEGTFHELVKPPFPFEEHNDKKKGITDITGITNLMLKDAKPFIGIYSRLAEFFLGVKTLVAHNLSYDREVLYWDLMRTGKTLRFPWPINHECTVEKSMHLKGYRLNLGLLHETLFGEKFDGAHRAQSDVEAVFKCYKKLEGKAEYGS